MCVNRRMEAKGDEMITGCDYALSRDYALLAVLYVNIGYVRQGCGVFLSVFAYRTI